MSLSISRALSIPYESTVNLLDFVQLLFRKQREGESFLRDPRSQLSQNAYRKGEQLLVGQAERVRVPQVLTQEHVTERTQAPNQPSIGEYQATVESKEKTHRSRLIQQPAQKEASSQSYQLENDLLQKDREIQGRRERYRIINLLKDDGWIRLYSGTQRLSRKPVWVKEYTSKQLSLQQVEHRKEQFEQLTRIGLTNSRRQDFRLITPQDTAISDNRYYLITEALNGLTLREYLKEIKDASAMPALQVRQALIQVLQTLWFLHSQKIRLLNGEIVQATHGNIGLDSLFMVPQTTPASVSEPQFLIYVCDLGLWEQLFKPATVPAIAPSAAEDLKALGYVGFNLLTNTEISPCAGEPFDFNSLDPELIQRWDSVGDRPLKQVILQLLGLVRPPFANAFNAREALLKPPEQESENLATPIASEKTAATKSSSAMLLLSLLGLGLLAGLIYWGVRGLLPPSVKPVVDHSPTTQCQGCLRQVAGVPSGKIPYVVEAGGSWSYALTQSGLVSSGELSGALASDDKTLMSELKRRDPRLQGYIRRQFVSFPNQASEQVRSGQAAFALISVTDSNQTPVNLQQETVAYDALAVFVANGQNIPQSFNQGKITFQQLRQFYTNVQSWDIPEQIKDWKPKQYIPFEAGTIDLFKQQVFEASQQNYLSQERAFFSLKDTVLSDQRQKLDNPKRFTTMNLFGELLQDAKDHKLGIGFAPLSMVFGQCAVYPLAVGEPGQEVQPLVQQSNQPIDPSTDLCNSKGNYFPNREAIASKHYPLSYSLVVIYPEDKRLALAGQKFVELLKTEEGQCLLSEAGLVPLHSCSSP